MTTILQSLNVDDAITIAPHVAGILVNPSERTTGDVWYDEPTDLLLVSNFPASTLTKQTVLCDTFRR